MARWANSESTGARRWRLQERSSSQTMLTTWSMTRRGNCSLWTRRQGCGQSSQGCRGGHCAISAWMRTFLSRLIPRRLAIDPQGGRVFANIADVDEVAVIDTASMKAITSALEADQGRRQCADGLRWRTSIAVCRLPHAGNADCPGCRDWQRNRQPVQPRAEPTISFTIPRWAASIVISGAGEVDAYQVDAAKSLHALGVLHYRRRRQDGAVCTRAESALCCCARRGAASFRDPSLCNRQERKLPMKNFSALQSNPCLESVSLGGLCDVSATC